VTADELIAAARLLHGGEHGALAALAQRVGVSYDSLRHMAAGRRPVPSGLAAEINELVLTVPRQVTVGILPAALPPDMDRDGPCADTVEPALDALAACAEAAGWHPAEVAAAALGWAVHRIADGAGVPAAKQALADAAEMVRLRPP
jgi:DNA-binding transcriptional regulator YdaS (Cro superfamily)